MEPGSKPVKWMVKKIRYPCKTGISYSEKTVPFNVVSGVLFPAKAGLLSFIYSLCHHKVLTTYPPERSGQLPV